jgi:hypothetical protein
MVCRASKLAASAGGAVQSAHKTLCWFVLVGWAIYPIGYMAGTEGWYSGIFGGLPMDVVYNVGSRSSHQLAAWTIDGKNR